MTGAYIVRFIIFLLLSLLIGIISAVSTPGAIASSVMVFGFGVAEICDAIGEAK